MAEERNIHIAEWPERPLPAEVAMDMRIKEPMAVCIKLCDPICVASEYTISIDIFDRPVGTITLRGRTTIYNCPEDV
jgi:hypothetical protein